MSYSRYNTLVRKRTRLVARPRPATAGPHLTQRLLIFAWTRILHLIRLAHQVYFLIILAAGVCVCLFVYVCVRVCVCVCLGVPYRLPQVRTNFYLFLTLSVTCLPTDASAAVRIRICFVALCSVAGVAGCAPANAPYVEYTDERGQVTLPLTLARSLSVSRFALATPIFHYIRTIFIITVNCIEYTI